MSEACLDQTYSDLAEIYGYTTKAFNQQVKNNIEKFDEDSMFQLSEDEVGELATKQSNALVRLFKQMKDYIVDNQQMINQRDFLRFSLQTAENAQNMIEFRNKLTEIDDKIENVVSNHGDMVRKSELSLIMLNLGKPEIPPGWLILNGQPVESDLAY